MTTNIDMGIDKRQARSGRKRLQAGTGMALIIEHLQKARGQWVSRSELVRYASISERSFPEHIRRLRWRDGYRIIVSHHGHRGTGVEAYYRLPIEMEKWFNEGH